MELVPSGPSPDGCSQSGKDVTGTTTGTPQLEGWSIILVIPNGKPRLFPGWCLMKLKNKDCRPEDLNKKHRIYWKKIQTPRMGRGPKKGLPPYQFIFATTLSVSPSCYLLIGLSILLWLSNSFSLSLLLHLFNNIISIPFVSNIVTKHSVTSLWFSHLLELPSSPSPTLTTCL